MKHVRMFFAIVLVASMASVAMAADTAPGAGIVPTYKANLSGAKVPPVMTTATGEAMFQLLRHGMTGGGTGGIGTGGAGRTDQGLGQDRGPFGTYPGSVPGGVPGAAPGGTMAAGDALRYNITVKNIKDVTAAHLHMGKKTSTEGPVIAALFLGPKKGGQFSGTLAQGTISDKDLQGPLAGKTVDDLVALINSGDVYVNVHTTKHPAGEIRGEVKEVS